MIQVDFSKEVTIVLDDYFISIKEAEDQINEFKSRFSWIPTSGSAPDCQDRTPLDPQHASVVMQEFHELYLEAEAAKGNAKDGEYFTALRVHVGAAIDQSIEMFYEPVCVKQESTTANSFTGRIHTAMINGDFYRYSDDPAENFVSVDANIRNASLGTYRQNLGVIRFRTGRTCRRPSSANDWTGDTRSALYSFQELFKLYELNYVDTGLDRNPDGSYNGDKEIRVWSGAVMKKPPVGNGGFDRFKHTILFSILPTMVKLLPPDGEPDKDQLANLGHVCPPETDCDRVTVPT